MPKSSLKVTDGMLPKKWTEPVAIYIRDKHGFDAWGNEDPVHVAQLTIEALETLDPSIGDHEKKRKWGN